MRVRYKIPLTIQNGDSLIFSDGYNEFPAADFTFNYTIVNAANKYTFTAVAATPENILGYELDGGDLFVRVAPEDTAKYIAGDDYTYYVQAEDDNGNKITVESGPITLIDEYSTVGDYRSHAKIMLDLLEAYLQGTAPDAVKKYSVAGRSIESYDLKEIVELRNYYKLIFENEVKKNKIARGERDYSSTTKVRFGTMPEFYRGQGK